jgi:hypothetical protein
VQSCAAGAGGVAPGSDAGAHGGAGGASTEGAKLAAPVRDSGTPPLPSTTASHRPSVDASTPQAKDSSTDSAAPAAQDCTPDLAFDFAACLANDPFDPDCIRNAGPCAPLPSFEDAATAADGGAQP